MKRDEPPDAWTTMEVQDAADWALLSQLFSTIMETASQPAGVPANIQGLHSNLSPKWD